GTEDGTAYDNFSVAHMLSPTSSQSSHSRPRAARNAMWCLVEQPWRSRKCQEQKPRGAAEYCLAATQKIPLVAFLGQHGTKHIKLPRAGGSGLGAAPPLRPYGSAHFGLGQD